MNQDPDEEKPSERRQGNKATMDEPQEEFVADQSVPSQSATPSKDLQTSDKPADET
ncbi:MAG TPA: hypothetical protein VF593_07900 [Chthoniobacteraceae bacterium]|jgi:hypothetical protein